MKRFRVGLGFGPWCLVLVLLLFGRGLGADVKALLMAAQEAMRDAQLGRAAGLYRQVLRAEPRNAYASNQLGLVLARQGDFAGARKQFGRTLQVAPDDLFARLWVGVAALGEEDLDGAFQAFQGVGQREARTEAAAAFLSNAYYFLGAIHAFRRDVDQAAVALEKARRMNVTDPDIRYRLGRLFHDLGDDGAAEGEYRRALGLDAGHIASMNALGWLLYNRGAREAAMEQWKQVLRVRPDNLDARDSLARACLDAAEAHRKAGRYAQARTQWRQTLTYDSKNRAARYFLGKYQGR